MPTKPSADDDVHGSAEHVPALHVADEVQTGPLQDPKHLAGELGALALLLADRHEADPGRGRADDLLGVEMTHDGELPELRRLGVQIGSDVQHHGPPPAGREDPGQGGTVHTVDRPDDRLGRDHRRTGVAGRDHGLGSAFAHQPGANPYGSVPLLADGCRRLLHRHHLVGVLDGNLLDPAETFELGLDLVPISDENDLAVILFDRAEGPFHRCPRREVASHGVDGNQHLASVTSLARVETSGENSWRAGSSALRRPQTSFPSMTSLPR